MNLLLVQDALKNASDQQLMQMMQAPDSTAPSYLVLSEIRRRKDMRSKQAPESDSRRTVAEELTAPEQPAGIRGLQPQMDPDGVDAVEGGDVQGMAAGGIVRMQEGGTPPDFAGVQYEEPIGPELPEGVQYAEPIGPEPPQRRTREPAGIGTLAPIQTERAPTLSEIMQRNASLFPENMGGIRERMREERVDPAARRNEAVNMALIEAGLRIAGSRNPSLIGAIGEGALPAVQGYGQQLGQIRTEQRQARQDELELAKQEVNRQYAIGQISAAEHRNTIAELGANNRLRHQLAAEAIRTERQIAGQAAVADRQAAAQAAITDRTFRLEDLRDRRARDLAEQQEQRRMRERAAIAANEAFGNLTTRETVRQALRDEARRANPSERNPTVSDQAVQERILRDTIARIEQAYQITLPGSRSGGSQPVINYDPNTRSIVR